MKFFTILLSCLLSGIFTPILSQTILYVTPDGDGTGILNDPANLQTALDIAGHETGDVQILLAAGTYTGNFEYISDTLLNKDLELLGGWSTDFTGRVVDPSNTILDGNGTGRVLRISPYQKSAPGSIRIEGFTIKNGHSTIGSGGGMLIGAFPPGEVIINKNIFENNKTEAPPDKTKFYSGGGFYVCNLNSAEQKGGKITISNNIVRNNIAGYNNRCGQGGGIFAYCTDTLLIYNNIIHGNISDEYEDAGSAGGGIEIYSTKGEVIVVNNTITGNTSALFAGGVGTHVAYPAWDNCHYHFYNNIIINNSYDGWLGDYDIFSDVSAVEPSPGNSITIKYCDFGGLGVWPNDGVDPVLSNNISTDPQFTLPGYNLKAGSACINKGTNSAPFVPEYDIAGNPRIIDGIIDIGAYENTGLVAYYPFNGNAADESGNGNNGTVNGVTLTTDRNGNPDEAYAFNGTSGYINCGNNTVLDITDEITLMAWFCLNELPEEKEATILSKAQKCNSSANYSLYITLNGQLRFQYYDGTGVDNDYLTTDSIQEDKWYHVALSYNYQTYAINFYMNGKKASGYWKNNNNPNHYPNVITTNDMSIGAWISYTDGCVGVNKGEPQGFLSGKIDDVKIYNRMLSEGEIKETGKVGPAAPENLVVRQCNEVNYLLLPDYADDKLYKINVYRSLNSPANILYDSLVAGSFDDTVLVDPVKYGVTYYYRVTAVDSSGFESSFSNEVKVQVKKAIDLGPDQELCAGESVRLDAGSGFTSYQWSVPDSTGRYLTVRFTGDYTVAVTDDYSCISFDTIGLVFHSDVDIDLGPDRWICPGGSLVLRAGSGFGNYLWNDGSGADTLVATGPGTYSVTVTATGECGGYDEVTLSYLEPYQEEELCLLTINKDNHVVIIWEKSHGKGIAYYKIYREYGTNQYISIDSVLFNELSVYADEASIPQEYPHKYKISVVDSCGQESELSDSHRTIFLQAGPGFLGKVNLVWTHYEGFSFSNYKILRGPSFADLSEIRSVPGSVLQWSIDDPQDKLLYYRVDVERPDACFPTSLKSDISYGSATSNLDDNGLLENMEPERSTDFMIYPNPLRERALICFPDPGLKKYTLVLTDLQGRVIRIENNLTGEQIVFNRGNLPAGIYNLEIKGDETFRAKVMIH